MITTHLLIIRCFSVAGGFFFSFSDKPSFLLSEIWEEQVREKLALWVCVLHPRMQVLAWDRSFLQNCWSQIICFFVELVPCFLKCYHMISFMPSDCLGRRGGSRDLSGHLRRMRSKDAPGAGSLSFPVLSVTLVAP